MFSFEGDFRAKRQINLGGQRSSATDKQALVLKTQEERQRREEERRRQKAATDIQAFYRAWMDVRRWRANVRVQWTGWMQERWRGAAVSAEELVHGVRSFLAFAQSPPMDVSQELEMLLKWLLRSESMRVWQSAVDQGSTELSGTLSWQFQRLTWLAWQHFVLAEVPEATRTSRQWIQAALLHDSPRRALYLEYFLRREYLGNVYHLLGQLVNSQDPHVWSPPDVLERAMFALDLAFLPFVVFHANPPLLALALDSFLTQFLAIPFLSTGLHYQLLQKAQTGVPVEALLLRFVNHAEDLLPKLKEQVWMERGVFYDGTLPLLANLLDLAGTRVDRMEHSFVVFYVQTISILLQKVPENLLLDGGSHETLSVLTYTLMTVANAGNLLAEEDEEDEGNVNNHFSPLPTASLSRIDDRFQSSLQLLSQPQHLETLFHRMNMFDTTASSNPDTTLVFSKLLASIILRIPSSKSSLLNAIVFWKNGVLLKTLWIALKSSALITTLHPRAIPITVFSDSLHANDWYMLTVVLEMITHYMLTFGNDEFFSDRNLMPHEEFVELSGILRNVVFYILQNPTSLGASLSGTTISVRTFCDVATKTLRQIHSRDSYKSFCPPGHWEMTELANVDAFLKSASEAAQRERVDPESTNQPTTNPHMRILKEIPFVIPFADRVKILRTLISVDAANLDRDFRGIRVNIRRDQLFEDGFAQLNPLGPRLKNRIQIVFSSAFGYEEAGVDGGGVFKEFLTDLSKRAFDPNLGLFQHTNQQLIYPNPHEYSTSEQSLQHYEFLGRIMGKALYEGILVDASFAPFFLNKWLGRLSYLEDLPSLDMELYKNLTFLKNYSGDVEDLALNFTIVSDEFGETKVVELVPGGRDIPVNNANRIRYIYLMAHYKLNLQIAKQSRAFLRGLSDLIHYDWLQMFNQQELHILVSGADRPIDLRDLRANTEYSGGYDDNHPAMHFFWSVLASFSNEECKKLLKFVTSCSRPPLLGFHELVPKFTIRNTGGVDVERLPTSSTCVNLLKLPPYPTEAVMREKLLYAIEAGAGFELS